MCHFGRWWFLQFGGQPYTRERHHMHAPIVDAIIVHEQIEEIHGWKWRKHYSLAFVTLERVTSYPSAPLCARSSWSSRIPVSCTRKMVAMRPVAIYRCTASANSPSPAVDRWCDRHIRSWMVRRTCLACIQMAANKLHKLTFNYTTSNWDFWLEKLTLMYGCKAIVLRLLDCSPPLPSGLLFLPNIVAMWP